MAILSVNAGSSSLKFALYPLRHDGGVAVAVLSGSIEGLEAGGEPRLSWRTGSRREQQRLPAGDGDEQGDQGELDGAQVHRLSAGSAAKRTSVIPASPTASRASTAFHTPV